MAWSGSCKSGADTTAVRLQLRGSPTRLDQGHRDAHGGKQIFEDVAMGLNRIAGVVALCLVAACTAPFQGPYIPLTRFTPATPARPLIAENRVDPYSGVIPACGDAGVLGLIKDRFASREAGYWDSSIEIAGFDAPYEIAYRPRGPTFVPRRYCSVTAQFSDNRPRKVFYSVDEGMGLVGFSWNVTWCPVGLDRDLTYAPGCKMARP
jgi:hypothetical protein